MRGRHPVRVLHVSQPTDGGVGHYVAAAAAHQAARGWPVAVACPDDGLLPRELSRHGVCRLRWAATRPPGPATIPEVARLRQLVAVARPDVVHLHSSKAGLAGRLALQGRRPTMFQPHGWSWLALRGCRADAAARWERAAAQWTRVLVCAGEGEAEQGTARGVRGRYAVVRNGVDLARFAPADGSARAAARDRLGLDPTVPVAVCVGRVTRQKGQDLLLAAWSAVASRHPTARLYVVGDGDLLPLLRRQAPATVSFVGTVEDVRPWYAAANVVVLPSRWEGLSLTVLEAMASARSVVATAVPGLAEAVPAGAGALVAPENPALLAAAVADRLGAAELAAAEGTAAAQHAARFDVSETLARLESLTRHVAGVPAQAVRPEPG
jgi:glycosyltransferase involved in cell wall biosynthesis